MLFPTILALREEAGEAVKNGERFTGDLALYCNIRKTNDSECSLQLILLLDTKPEPKRAKAYVSPSVSLLSREELNGVFSTALLAIRMFMSQGKDGAREFDASQMNVLEGEQEDLLAQAASLKAGEQYVVRLPISIIAWLVRKLGEPNAVSLTMAIDVNNEIASVDVQDWTFGEALGLALLQMPFEIFLL